MLHDGDGGGEEVSKQVDEAKDLEEEADEGPSGGGREGVIG